MGKILTIVLVILLIVFLAAAGAGIYFYNYYVFKTMRVCISDAANDTLLTCGSGLDCKTKFLENNTNFDEMMASAPVFVQDKIREIFDKAIYCEGTCKVKAVYGDGFGESVESCEIGDEEILIEIHGAEGVEILKFMKKNSGKFK